MALYAIGDIHGCYEAFRRLLAVIKFNRRRDKLWLVGDLINRGPASADVLRWMKAHDDCVTAVLGNHDLHLLAARAGVVQAKEKDTFTDILNAPDADELCAWLRRRPLAYREKYFLLIHAGVLPSWSADDVMRLAAEAEAVVRGDGWAEFAAAMYGDKPDSWSESLAGHDRLRVILNALTRLRICTPDGRMAMNFTGTAMAAPAGYVPWFEAPQRRSFDSRVVFGHWSSLGVMRRKNTLCLDSGCFWGGLLSAVRLPDGRLFQVTAE